MSYADVAEKGKIRPLMARKGMPEQSAAERVKAWEDGSIALTWRQLENLAKIYRRPAITFFLNSPPVEEVKLSDFRTIGDKPANVDSPEFSAFMRRIEILHESIIDLAKAANEEPLQFLGSITTDTQIHDVIYSIRKTIDFSYSEQEQQADKDEMLRALRNKIQDAGIFILIEGDLGSYHSKITPDEFRGIAISHPLAPLIVINPYDTPAARIFTLMHELVHLWLGDSGISNIDVFHGISSNNKFKEAFCNEVAAEFVVPTELCLSYFSLTDPSDWQNTIVDLARKFKVSKAVIARRLYDLNKIDNDAYWKYFHMLKKNWIECKSKQNDLAGGPSKNVLDRYRLGEKIINTVIGGAEDGLISLQDASRILKVKVRRFNAITQ